MSCSYTDEVLDMNAFENELLEPADLELVEEVPNEGLTLQEMYRLLAEKDQGEELLWLPHTKFSVRGDVQQA